MASRGGKLEINYGTLYPSLLKLEQEGYISGSWGASENNRRARFYKLTAAGRKQLENETREWNATTEIVARFLAHEES
jgi:PadR family transcriptional regulator, regulatory protein PadR